MRVVVCKATPTDPTHDRPGETARAVEEAGLGVDVVVVRGLRTTMSHGAGAVVLDVDDQGADVVVVQSPRTDEMIQCARILQARGIAVVVDVDGPPTGGPPGHPNPGRAGTVHHLAGFCREADMVTVSTPSLAREYAGHGRGAVVPHAVPRRLAELPPAYERLGDVVDIGWSGDADDHPHDLEQVGSGLQQAIDATGDGARFTLLGRRGDGQQRLGLRVEPREALRPLDADAYARAVGEVFDIGIAPLRIDRSNTATSWLKVLEYAARGVYPVRSATAEYERLGLGWRAKAPRDWAKALTKAVQDDDWRREQARAAHQVVLDRHLTEHTVPLWLAAWQRAAENRATALRRGAVAVG